ncbi:substrate-binding domain-containing protein, partial [Candidatus Calescamantes bacterium]|nr:substrate-binding domain-containing protein [Candidatus Calescamantes bacterium]
PEEKFAQELGISRMTLRRALGILVEEGLIGQRKGKGTFVISPLEEKKTERKVIGLLGYFRLEKSPDPYYSLLLQGIKDGVEDQVKLVILSPLEKSLLELYHQEHLDGMMFITPSRRDIKEIKELPLQHIIHVIVGSSFQSLKQNNYILVDTDNIGGAFKAVEYLIRLGHKRIAYIGGNPEKSNSRDRLKGYKKALRRHRIGFDVSLMFEVKKGNYSDSAYEITNSLLETQSPPTAIFAGGFSLALGVMKAIKERGLKIPENISVVGFDDYELGSHLSPPLTTVRQPIYELGKIAGKRVLEQINYGRIKKRETILPTELIIRGSCSKRKECFKKVSCK